MKLLQYLGIALWEIVENNRELKGRKSVCHHSGGCRVSNRAYNRVGKMCTNNVRGCGAENGC